MCAVCLIRVETQGPGALLLSVLTSDDLNGRTVERRQVSDPDQVLSLVRKFLDRSTTHRLT